MVRGLVLVLLLWCSFTVAEEVEPGAEAAFFASLDAKGDLQKQGQIRYRVINHGNGGRSPKVTSACDLHWRAHLVLPHGKLQAGGQVAVPDPARHHLHDPQNASNIFKTDIFKEFLPSMVEGDVVQLYIPSDHARGADNEEHQSIPAGAPLMVKLKLVKIQGESSPASDKKISARRTWRAARGEAEPAMENVTHQVTANATRPAAEVKVEKANQASGEAEEKAKRAEEEKKAAAAKAAKEEKQTKAAKEEKKAAAAAKAAEEEKKAAAAAKAAEEEKKAAAAAKAAEEEKKATTAKAAEEEKKAADAAKAAEATKAEQEGTSEATNDVEAELAKVEAEAKADSDRREVLLAREKAAAAKAAEAKALQDEASAELQEAQAAAESQ